MTEYKEDRFPERELNEAEGVSKRFLAVTELTSKLLNSARTY